MNEDGKKKTVKNNRLDSLKINNDFFNFY